MTVLCVFDANAEMQFCIKIDIVGVNDAKMEAMCIMFCYGGYVH